MRTISYKQRIKLIRKSITFIEKLSGQKLSFWAKVKTYHHSLTKGGLKIHWRIDLDILMGNLIHKVTRGSLDEQLRTWFNNKYPQV